MVLKAPLHPPNPPLPPNALEQDITTHSSVRLTRSDAARDSLPTAYQYKIPPLELRHGFGCGPFPTCI